LIAWRHPRNPIGWLFCGAALVTALGSDAAQGWALRATTDGWPGVVVGEGLAASSWLPSGFGWTLTFVLFPDGHLPGRRWRLVPWIGAVGLLLAVPGWALSPDRKVDFSAGRNPWAVPALPTDALVTVGMTLFIGALLASAVSIVVRLRRSVGDERQQLKWFALAAVFAGIALPARADRRRARRSARRPGAARPDSARGCGAGPAAGRADPPERHSELNSDGRR
jgi:hypothetical protein